MKHLRYHLLLLSIFISLTQLNGQSDSIHAVHAGVDGVFFNNWSSTVKTDTIIDNLHNTHPRNFNGNLGLASPTLSPEMKDSKLGVQYFSVPYKNDLFGTEEKIFFKAWPIYTSIQGNAGQRQEQMMKLTHTQRIQKNWQLGMRLNRYKCDGFYLKQTSFVNNFLASLQYEGSKKRYGMYTHFIFNKIKSQENGGVNNDSILIENPNVNKLLLNINLTDAKRTVRNMVGGVNQFFQLNKNVDSISALNHKIWYNISYEGNYYQYTDPNPQSGFYSDILIDSLKTNDSTHLRKFMNEARYMLENNKKYFALYVGYKNELATLNRNKIDSFFTNHIAEFGGYWEMKNREYKVNLETEYVVDGAYAGDYRINLWDEWKMKFKKSIMASRIVYDYKTPEQYFFRYSSNHARWDQNLVKTTTLQGWFLFDITDWGLSLETYYKNQQYPIYFDTLSLPRQYDGAIGTGRVSLTYKLKLWKLRFNNTLNYQINDHPEILRQPDWIVNSQLYIQDLLFKKNLNIQIGFECNYFSEYTPYGYNPALNAFYLQDKRTAGNYPFIDFFINMQIRPVQFFVKLNHVNLGLTGANYAFTPGYYQPDRAFKFGLKWTFID